MSSADNFTDMLSVKSDPPFHSRIDSRRFYISLPHDGCEGDKGYLQVITHQVFNCNYDNQPTYSSILYSDSETYVTWATGNGKLRLIME